MDLTLKMLSLIHDVYCTDSHGKLLIRDIIKCVVFDAGYLASYLGHQFAFCFASLPKLF